MRELFGQLTKALAARKGLLSSHTNAYRLFGGKHEGCDGLTIDRYDKALVFYLAEQTSSLTSDDLVEIARWYQNVLPIEDAYLKILPVDRSRVFLSNDGKFSRKLVGNSKTDEFVVMENSMYYLVRLNEGFSTGIFLDNRNQRAYFHKRADGKTVLNCFSYTCTFSVACAIGGGTVTSVDISRKFLEWGKENFSLNHLHSEKHRFICDDTLSCLHRCIKRNEQFDIVILDPPSFSRNRQGKVFSIEKDFKQLVTLGFNAVKPGGLFFFSTNCQRFGFDMPKILKQIRSWKLQPSFTKDSLMDAGFVPDDFKYDANYPVKILMRK